MFLPITLSAPLYSLSPNPFHNNFFIFVCAFEFEEYATFLLFHFLCYRATMWRVEVILSRLYAKTHDGKRKLHIYYLSTYF